jgi:hypothetical protein
MRQRLINQLILLGLVCLAGLSIIPPRSGTGLDSQLSFQSQYPVLVLDQALGDYYGGEIYMVLTCFDDSPEPVTVQVLFNSLITAYEATQDFFVNQEIIVKTSGSWGELLSGKNHNLTIIASDCHHRTNSINHIFEVDKTPPVVLSVELSAKKDEQGRRVIYYDQTLKITWSVEDEHFERVEIVIEGDLAKTGYDKEETKSISFDLPGALKEKRFTVEVIAYDRAQNTAKETFRITYIDNREFKVPGEETNRGLYIAGAIIGGVGVFAIVGFVWSAIMIKKRQTIEGVQ